MAKSKAKNESEPQNKAVSKTDHLLDCLEFLTAHYGRAKSKRALTSGLAYDGRYMRPELFKEAAERLAIKTQIIKIK